MAKSSNQSNSNVSQGEADENEVKQVREEEMELQKKDQAARHEKKAQFLALNREEREKVNNEISGFLEETKADIPVALEDWSEENGYPTEFVKKCLSRLRLPYIRIGNTIKAYKIHLQRAVRLETERQIRAQAENRSAVAFLVKRRKT